MSRANLAAALLIAALSAALLSWGHPHEDAYILFCYADDWATGHGISYYPGGPRVEGATDFLWMAAIAALRFLHLPSPLGAALLTTAAGWTASRLIVLRRAAFPFVVLLVLSPTALVSYLGFGALAFATLAVWAWVIVARGSAAGIVRSPWLLLALALVRPDGVILAVGFGLVAAARARRLGVLRRWLSMTALAVAGGTGYFVWRAAYFGTWLPLPLEVKRHGGHRFPGAEGLFDWALESVVPLGVSIALGAVLMPKSARRVLWRHLRVAWPFGLHALAMTLGLPLQNTAHRFYAPATLALLAMVALAACLLRGTRSLLVTASACLMLVPSSAFALREIRAAARPYDAYLTSLSMKLPRVAPSARIATTEAGRIAYYSRAPCLDLVGLDTRETALAPPTFSLLDDFAPDIVVVHPAGVADWTHPNPRGLRLDEPYAESGLGNVEGAAVATLAWLAARNDRYQVFVVPTLPGATSTFHIVALRRGPLFDALAATLRESIVERPPSYFSSLVSSSREL